MALKFSHQDRSNEGLNLFLSPLKSRSFEFFKHRHFLTNYRFWPLATASEKGMLLNWPCLAQDHCKFNLVMFFP